MINKKFLLTLIFSGALSFTITAIANAGYIILSNDNQAKLGSNDIVQFQLIFNSDSDLIPPIQANSNLKYYPGITNSSSVDVYIRDVTTLGVHTKNA